MEPCCIQLLAPPSTRSRSVARFVVPSLRLPRLAAQERIGMALEIVSEHPQRSRRPAHFLQSAAYLLDLRRIRPGQRGSVIESPARARERALCGNQRSIQLGNCFLQVFTDLLERHLVELLDDVLHCRFGRLELS